ncbi:MAG: GTPase [Candidatus Micrarchaeota archaeon]
MANFKRRTWAIASRMIREAHLVIEVCDARDIEGTRLSRLDKGIQGKLIITATKSDLCNKPFGVQFTLDDGVQGIYCSSRSKDGVEKLVSLLSSRARDMVARGKGRFDSETGKRMIDILIFGIPNVGKSSLINALTGRRAAPTGFRAGITRGPQWISLWPGVRLVDMPGLIDNKMTAQDLALFSALDVEKLHEPEEVAEKIIRRYVESKDPGLFMHYGIEEGADPEEVLASIACKYGKLLKGGEPNLLEAAKFVIRDWQKGKLSWVQATKVESIERERYAQAQLPYTRRPENAFRASDPNLHEGGREPRPSTSSDPYRPEDRSRESPPATLPASSDPSASAAPPLLRPPEREASRPSRFYPRLPDESSSRRGRSKNSRSPRREPDKNRSKDGPRSSRPLRSKKSYKRPAGRERQHRMHKR